MPYNAAESSITTPLGRAHAKRLREVYRSAGWPCQDLLEIELLAAGLLEGMAGQRRAMKSCASPRLYPRAPVLLMSIKRGASVGTSRALPSRAPHRGWPCGETGAHRPDPV